LDVDLFYAQHVDADPVTRDILDRWTDMLTRLGTV
jgi:hypothetical protein